MIVDLLFSALLGLGLILAQSDLHKRSEAEFRRNQQIYTEIKNGQ